ncbi:ribonuclease H-like domain-containing protein [Tanacetum coccineum]
MAYYSTSSNSEVSTDSNCSSSCLKNVKILKEQNEQLLKDLMISKLNDITYKTGLESVEERLLVYKKNDSVYEEDIKLIIEKLENSSKSLSKLIDCQIVDKCKTGLGYNAVPPPYTGNFMPPKPDLSFFGLEEFVNEPIVSEPTVKKPIVETSEAKANADKPKVVRKNFGPPIIEDWVSNSKEKDVPQAKIEKKTIKPSFTKIEFVKPKGKTARKTAKQVDCKKVNQKEFQNTKPIWKNAQRVNHQNFAKKTHPYAKKNIVLRAVLMKSGLVSVNTARQVNAAHTKTTVNAARPMSYLSKIAHSTVKRPIHKNTTFKNINFNQRVNTVKDKNVNTIRPKAVVNAAKPKAVVNVARPKAVVNAVKGNNVNVVKASACWVWKPKTKVLDYGNPQMDLHDKGVIDSGCSRHMIGNMSYLTDYEEIDRGYVAFGGNPKGRKITGKGKKACDDAGKARMETIPSKDYILLPLWTADPLFSQSSKSSLDDGFKPSGDDEKKVTKELGKEGGDPSKEDERDDQEKDASVNSTNNVNVASTNEVNDVGIKASIKLPDEPNMPALENIVYLDDDEDVGTEAGMNKLDAFMPVSLIPTTRVHKDHPVEQIRTYLATKDETNGIIKSFITGIENLVDHKVKVIRCDNGTEFKNNEMNQFCKMKGILRQYSVARTPQQWSEPLSNGNCSTKASDKVDDGFKPSSDDGKKVDEDPRK